MQGPGCTLGRVAKDYVASPAFPWGSVWVDTQDPWPGRQAVLPPSSLSRSAVGQAGRADPPFVVALGAAGLVGWPGLAQRGPLPGEPVLGEFLGL